MEFGTLLTYKDKERAVQYLGKEVVFSNNLYMITEYPNLCEKGILEKVGDIASPFVRILQGKTFTHQFVRTIAEGKKENKRRLGRIYTFEDIERVGDFVGKQGLFFNNYRIAKEMEYIALQFLETKTLLQVWPSDAPFIDNNRKNYQFFIPVIEEEENVKS